MRAVDVARTSRVARNLVMVHLRAVLATVNHDGRVIQRLAVGLAALGRPAYINLGREGDLPGDRSVGAMRAACWAVLDGAYAAGVRWVDVARSYGLAEEFLAGWVEERD